jgi:hypothetical protein
MTDDVTRLFHQARAGTDARREDRLPAEIVNLYQRACRGDRQARILLNRHFGRKPWMCGIMDRDDGPPPNPQWDAAGAAAIRRQLEAAAS